MFANKAFIKRNLKTSKRILFIVALCLSFFLNSYLGSAEEPTNDSPPSTPDTGSLEEDFSAGGTRENHLLTQLCNKNGQNIAYLLGNQNREFTLSAYSTFWFYIPNTLQEEVQLKFVLKEMETDNQIYDRILEVPNEAGIIGIALPDEQKYALTPNINYSWSLEVKCGESNHESEAILEGWLQRLIPNADLQKQLANTPTEDRYQIYLQNDLLYDALDNLAQQLIITSNDSQLRTVWNQFLNELGWQNLVQNPILLKM